MKRLFLRLVLLSLPLALFGSWACSPAPVATPTLPAKEPAPARGSPWEQKWDRIRDEGKKEGIVSFYATSWGPEIRTALTEAVKEKFGITLEFTPFARGAELVARVQQEKSAGLYVADVFGAGGGTLVTTMKPLGLMGSLEPFLVLPEIMDAKVWRGGNFPFLDRDKKIIIMVAGAQRYLMYNTDLIQKGEITTYRDVLKPQYKGKITLNDPTVTGAGNALMGHLGLHLWNAEEARQFLSQLLKQQEAVIQRDNRLHVESVAKGKFAIGLAPNEDNMAQFLKAGAPLAISYPKEGVYIAPGAGSIAVPVRSAHPNAASVFINWLLTKEGQTVYSRARGTPSMRTDVSTEGMNPVFIAQPGEKIFLPTEESFEFWGKMIEIAQEVVKEASK